MSSRLIAPKVGEMLATVSMNDSVVGAAISISKTSSSANCLKSIALPSITGLAAKAPIAPSPKTALPLVTMPTRLPLFVYS